MRERENKGTRQKREQERRERRKEAEMRRKVRGSGSARKKTAFLTLKQGVVYPDAFLQVQCLFFSVLFLFV